MPALVRWHVTGKWRREAVKTLNQPSDKVRHLLPVIICSWHAMMRVGLRSSSWTRNRPITPSIIGLPVGEPSLMEVTRVLTWL